MRLRTVLALTFLTASLRPEVASAQTPAPSLQAELGREVVTTIVGFAAHEVIVSLFGGGEHQLTQEDLAEAIKVGFENAAEGEIDVDVDAL